MDLLKISQRQYKNENAQIKAVHYLILININNNMKNVDVMQLP